MSALVDLLHGTATALHVADMPADPFAATDLLDGCEHLAAELVTFTARVRAHRVAHSKAWAAHTTAVRAALDPEGAPPPPPPPPPDPAPEPAPPEQQPEPAEEFKGGTVKTVWKFRIMDERGVQVGTVPMPDGAIARHVGMQDGWLCLWAEVDTDVPTSEREFVMVGTGYTVPESTSYVGSTQDGPLVWHLYEVRSATAPEGAAAPSGAGSPVPSPFPSGQGTATPGGAS